jgi:hypothetical protein
VDEPEVPVVEVQANMPRDTINENTTDANILPVPNDCLLIRAFRVFNCDELTFFIALVVN